MEELLIIQQKLNAPKTQFNKFGNYNFRSCEDILEAVKPLLAETHCTLQLNDEIVLVGERYYIKATALLTNKDGKVATASAYAREQEKVTGQIEAQITGAASSYARKYSLNALFCIDDNKDPDATNTHGKTSPVTPIVDSPKSTKAKGAPSPLDAALTAIEASTTRKELEDIYASYGPSTNYDPKLIAALKKRADRLKQ